MNRPLACPFCGSTIIDVVTPTGMPLLLAYVECEDCGANGPTGYGKQAVDEAIRLWNAAPRKADPVAEQERHDAARKPGRPSWSMLDETNG